MSETSKKSHVASASRTLASQSGQALTEFAFVLPILLLLALGVIEIGRYAYIAILVGNAARAGTAYGAQSLPTSGDTAGIASAAKGDFAGGSTSSNTNNGLGGNSLTVTSFPTCSCDSAGTLSPSPTQAYCYGTGGGPGGIGTNNNAGSCAAGHWVVILNVTASGTFNSLFNYPGIPSSVTVSRTSSMRVGQN